MERRSAYQIIIFIFKKYDMTTIFNLVQLTKLIKGGVSKAELRSPTIEQSSRTN